jgi:hypothetical protein
MSRVRVLSIVVLGGLLGVCSVTSAQSLGMFRQPFCNVVTFDITQNGWMLGLKGTDLELRPGGCAWLSVSEANRKEHFRDVDGDEVLAKIAQMPIREWNYKTQDAAIRHMGPTAQDFRAAFRLGEDPLKISTIDADGVALRAIQALEARTRTQHERMLEDTQSLADQNDSLVQENAERIAEIATLKADIAALRAAMAALREPAETL